MEVTLANTIYLWLASVLGWTVLYNFLCWLSPHRSQEWHCRVVTCIHALSAVIIATWCQFVQGPFVFDEAGGPNTPLQQGCVIMSWSYFSYDLIWCLYHKTESQVMLLHHIVSNIGLSVTACKGMYGSEMTATLFGTEITNPLLQLRWFLREIGQYETWLGDINDIIFIALFGGMRLGLGSLLLYRYYEMDTDLFGRCGGTSIYAISWVFFIMIVKFAVKKYTKRYQKRKLLAKEQNGNVMIADDSTVVEGKKDQ